jgi:geranylgeranyl diphosphate synthase type I
MRETFLYPELRVDRSIKLSSEKALQFLTWYKGQLEPFLDAYFDAKIDEASKIHPEAVVLSEGVRRFIRNGGKRVRPAFAYSAYVASGGRSLEAILYASAALEVLHAWALIHDDIIDNANLRRGKPSVHKVFEDFHRKRALSGSAGKFGTDAAILVGDLALTFADELLNTAPFPAERIRRAKEYYDLMKKQVILGEYLDVVAPLKKQITERDLLTILEYKTAKYTVERPMHIGAVLAGAEEDTLRVFSSYAIPLGQAFQIQDDIMGTFSNEAKIGKPVDSDIKEGKRTLLVLKAYEFSKGAEKRLLDTVLGNQSAGEAEIEAARQIMRESGALEYSQELAYKLIKKAKGAILQAKLVEEGREYLLQAADYLLTRSV